ncbi:hypothetical protein WG66_010995 [Moniliophthora roreri]|nr:hypothetical protein WG66_010995 [Moniliophthora roreri]
MRKPHATGMIYDAILATLSLSIPSTLLIPPKTSPDPDGTNNFTPPFFATSANTYSTSDIEPPSVNIITSTLCFSVTSYSSTLAIVTKEERLLD